GRAVGGGGEGGGGLSGVGGPFFLAGRGFSRAPPLPGFSQPGWAPWAVLAYIVAVSFLMVSTIPTFAGKVTGDRVARNYPMLMLVALAGLLWLLLNYPYATLAAGTVVYFGLMPLGVRRFLQLTKPGADDSEL